MALAFSLQNVQFRRLGRRPRHSLLPCDRDLPSGIVYPLLECRRARMKLRVPPLTLRPSPSRERETLLAPPEPQLKWHIVFMIGSFSLRRRLCHCRLCCSRGGGSLAIEKPDAICDHFRHFALLAILSLVRTDLQPPFHPHH